MLTPAEEKFISYWEQNSEKEKKLLRQVYTGLPIGLVIAAAIVLSVDANWYTRANMIANTKLNPAVFIIALLAIVVFVAIFYKKFQWDQKQQQYLELMHKKKVAEKNG